MSDEPMVTEREARVREREAFEDGAQWQFTHTPRRLSVADEAHAEAKLRYPITKKVLRSHPHWQIGVNEILVPNPPFAPWRFTRSDAVDMLDLLENPYEEVDE